MIHEAILGQILKKWIQTFSGRTTGVSESGSSESFILFKCVCQLSISDYQKLGYVASMTDGATDRQVGNLVSLVSENSNSGSVELLT